MDIQEPTVFGIDLGTTYSCIAYVNTYGEPIIIPNNDNEATTPSVVYFEEDNCIVGKEAKNYIEINANSAKEMVKRDMGREDYMIELNDEEYSPEEISACILKKLVLDAQQRLERTITDVVITCPAYFGIAEREATVHAGEIAGLNVRSIINEPSAAAIMYGVHNEQDQVVLAYDLGGGTFDVTVIEIKGGAITVIATGGDKTLGGHDWDEKVVRYFADQWKSETNSPGDLLESPETSQYLFLKAEDVKRSLTKTQERSIRIDHDGKSVNVKLTRNEFNQLTAALLERTIIYTKFTLDAAKKRGFDHIDKILLVGGSTKMPQVAERLVKEFGIPCKMFDQDEAVAKGAAIYGYKLLIDDMIHIQNEGIANTSFDEIDIEDFPTATKRAAQQQVAATTGIRLPIVEKFHNMQVTNVASHSFGILAEAENKVSGKRKEVISNLVIVNDTLPVSKEKKYYKPQFKDIRLAVIENDEALEIVRNTEIGEAIGDYCWPLSNGFDSRVPIYITFELNDQGRLLVTGIEPISNENISLVIDTKRGISEEKMRLAKVRINQLRIL